MSFDDYTDIGLFEVRWPGSLAYTYHNTSEPMGSLVTGYTGKASGSDSGILCREASTFAQSSSALPSQV